MSDEFRILSPCSRDRDSLDGQGAVRYCADCRKDVYDFARLRRRDINRLVAGGSVCGIIEREPDGVMRTADGPAWPRLVRRQFLRWIAGFASLRFAFAQPPALKAGTGGLRGVVSEAPGRPIGNARVWIGEERMAQTGALGRFEFTDVRPGRHLLSVDASGYMPQRVFVEVFAGRVVEVPSADLLLKVQALAGEIGPPPRILAAALGGVTGTITDQSGATVAHARVQVAIEAGAPIRTVSSSDLGLFLIKDLAPGEYQLRVEVPGFMRRQLNVTVGSTQNNLGQIELKVGSVGEVVEIPTSTVRRLWYRMTR